MDINATLIGQLITFAILVFFTMKYVWPIIEKAIHDRQVKIASGLEAAEKGKKELELANREVTTILRDAKTQASSIIEQANVHSAKIIDDARRDAKSEGMRIVAQAQSEIEREVAKAKEGIKAEVIKLTLLSTEKILQQQLDVKTQQNILNQLATDI